jgi:hypothetical protein
MRSSILYILVLTSLFSTSIEAWAEPHATVWAPGQMILDAEQSGRIVGRITDSSNKETAKATRIELLQTPLSKGRVFPEPWVPLGNHSKPVVLAELLSAADGRFRVDGLAPGNYIIRCAKAPRGNGSVKLTLSVEKPVRNVELVFNQGREAKGAVVDSHGSPLAHVFVYVAGIDLGDGLNAIGADEPAPWTRSDRDGRFSLSQLPDGVLYVQAAHEELGFSTLAALSQNYSGGELRFEIEVDPERFELARNPGGIGVSLRWTPRGPIISAVVAGKPASLAGLLEGDLITKIDGHSTLFMSSVEFIARCRGPVGSPVRLQIRRPDSTRELHIERVLLAP